MEQDNKQATSEKGNQEKQVPNQQNNQAEKAPQQDLKTSNQNPQNKDSSQKGHGKDANEATTKPTFAQKPTSDQVKHIQ